MKYISLMLIALLFASCATTTTNNPAYNPGYASNAEWMAANGIVPPEYTPTPQDPNAPRMNVTEIARANAMIQRKTTPTPQPGVSGWDVLGAAILFPLLLPVAMIANYPSYSGVHCRSYVYKDNYHTKCY